MNRFIILSMSLSLVLLIFTGCTNSKPFTADVAKEKGYVISYEVGGKSDNLVKMIAFADKVKKGEKAEVNVVDFSGKTPKINHVFFDGKTFKATSKENPDDKGKTQTCRSFDNEGNGIFILTDCDSDKGVPLIATSNYFYDSATAQYKEQQNK